MDLQKSLQLLLIILAFLFISLLVYYLIKQAINKIGNSCVDGHKWDPVKKTCVPESIPCPDGTTRGTDGNCSQSCPATSKNCGDDDYGLCYDENFEFCDTTNPNNPIICPKPETDPSCGDDDGGSLPMICPDYGSYLQIPDPNPIISKPSKLDKDYYKVISGTCTVDGTTHSKGDIFYTPGTDEHTNINCSATLLTLTPVDGIGGGGGGNLEDGRTYVVVESNSIVKDKCGTSNNNIGQTFKWNSTTYPNCNIPDIRKNVSPITYTCHSVDGSTKTTYGDIANTIADADTCCPIGQVSYCDTNDGSPTKGRRVCVECNGAGYGLDTNGECCLTKQQGIDPHKGKDVCCNDSTNQYLSKKWIKGDNGIWSESTTGKTYCCPKYTDGQTLPVADNEGNVMCRFACGKNTQDNPYEFCNAENGEICTEITIGDKTSNFCNSVAGKCVQQNFEDRHPRPTINTKWLACQVNDDKGDKPLYCAAHDRNKLESTATLNFVTPQVTPTKEEQLKNSCTVNDCLRQISTFISGNKDGSYQVQVPQKITWEGAAGECTIDYSNLCKDSDFIPDCGDPFTSSPTQNKSKLTNPDETDVSKWQVCEGTNNKGQIAGQGEICLTTNKQVNLIADNYYYRDYSALPKNPPDGFKLTQDPCPKLDSYDKLPNGKDAIEDMDYFTTKEKCLTDACNPVNYNNTSHHILYPGHAVDADTQKINDTYLGTNTRSPNSGLQSYCCNPGYFFVVNDATTNPNQAGFCIPPKKGDTGVQDECNG